MLEVLIAFAILAIGLVALIQAFSQGVHGSRAAEERAIAVMLARSKLAEVGRSIPLEEGEFADEVSDGFEWSLVITPADNSKLDLGQTSGFHMFDVEVTIHREDTELIEIRSYQLGASK